MTIDKHLRHPTGTPTGPHDRATKLASYQRGNLRSAQVRHEKAERRRQEREHQDTTETVVRDTVLCRDCARAVTCVRDAEGFWCCAACGQTIQDVEGTAYDDWGEGPEE